MIVAAALDQCLVTVYMKSVHPWKAIVQDDTQEMSEEEAVDQDDDRISIDDLVSETGGKEKTFTKEELEAEFARRNVASLNSKFDRLCSALAEGRRGGGHW